MLGSNSTNENCIHEEIKGRLIWGMPATIRSKMFYLKCRFINKTNYCTITFVYSPTCFGRNYSAVFRDNVFLSKAACGTLVPINIFIYNNCRMLKVYVKIVVVIHRKRLTYIKFCLQTSCPSMWGEPRLYSRCGYHKCQLCTLGRWPNSYGRNMSAIIQM
jgi:hypothetical protein